MVEQRLPIIGPTSASAPIEPVLRAGFEAAGRSVTLERWEPRPHQLGDALAKLRGRSYLGAVVMAPHKERTAAALSSLSEDAKVSGAVSVISRDRQRLVGHNTDVDGVRAGITAILPAVEGRWPRTAMVLGAGGGARAAVTVLIGAGFQHITVFNRHLHKAEALVADLAKIARHMELRARPWHETLLEAEVGRAGLLVDASGQGVADDGGLLPAEALPERLYLLDLALHRHESALMRSTKARGGTVANGRTSFLAAQAMAFHLWTGDDPPPGVLEEALAAALAEAGIEHGIVGD